MSFERHVFISYAHIDNQPLTPEQKGWVTLLHATLQTMLSQRIGGRADIWRDDKLRGNDVFADEILDQFPRTASLVSVLTPRYLKSEWCTREIEQFCAVAQQTGGVVVDNKSRVFKVLKTPVDKVDSLPAAVTGALGYEFYDYDEDRTPRELDPVYGQKAREDFLRKVNKLAWDIAQLLGQLDAGVQRQGGSSGNAEAARPVVYLAECSRDRRDAREVVQAELERYGYTVVPDRQLPTDEAEYVTTVERLLTECAFSVHLVGAGYGLVPDGPSQKSVVVLQNELAAARSRSAGLKRVIWLPDGTRSEQAPQQAFIDGLHRDADLQAGADLITGDLEDLKGVVRSALKALEQPRTGRRDSPGPGRGLVYVLCDERDRRDTVPLLKFLKGRGLDAALPVFTGDATQVREANQELVMSCAAVILFYGAGDEAWRFHQGNELRKIQGLRRDRPLLAAYTYLAGARTDDKDLLLALEEPHVVNGLNGLSEQSLAEFLRAVEPSSAGPA